MSILGLSAKAQNGKDTVAKIIQYFAYDKEMKNISKIGSYYYPIDIFIDELKVDKNLFENSTWQIKKFAYALKQICSILTGIPVEDFEKDEIKNSYWNPSNGKIFKANEVPSDGIVVNSVDSYKYQILENKLDNVYILIRLILQYEGTDVGRMYRGDNCWVNALMSQYKLIANQYKGDGLGNPIIETKTEIYPNWIITDVRFENEANAIKNKNGILIRINRNNYSSNVPEHISETALDNFKFDYVINNETGNFEKLVNDVKEIMIKENLL
jgi:hypothetical protein